jgi:DNA-binding LytR/AlgR family response regulator
MSSIPSRPAVRTLIFSAGGRPPDELVAAVRGARDLQLLDASGTSANALERVRALRPELVIVQLDRDSPRAAMPLEQLARLVPALVLSTPDRGDAALAFDVGALDFWIAGREQAGLSRTIARLHAHQHAEREARIGRKVIEAVRRRDTQAGHGRIALRSDGMMVMVDPSTIQHLESVGNYVRVVHAAGPTVVRCTLEALAARLGPAFIRIHRSHVVAADRVRALHTSRNGREVLLTDGTSVPLGRRYAAGVEQSLSHGHARNARAFTMESIIGSLAQTP